MVLKIAVHPSAWGRVANSEAEEPTMYPQREAPQPEATQREAQQLAAIAGHRYIGWTSSEISLPQIHPRLPPSQTRTLVALLFFSTLTKHQLIHINHVLPIPPAHFIPRPFSYPQHRDRASSSCKRRHHRRQTEQRPERQSTWQSLSKARMRRHRLLNHRRHIPLLLGRDISLDPRLMDLPRPRWRRKVQLSESFTRECALCC